MKTRTKWLMLIAVALFGSYAIAENVDLVSSPRPQWFQNGVYIGTGSTGVSVPDGTATATGTGLKVFGGASIVGSLTLPATSALGAMSYYAGGQPEAIFSTGILAHTGATKLGGYGLPGLNSVGTGRAFTLTAMTGAITTASSSGTGSEQITVTDGTNTCTFTLNCTTNAPSGTNSVGAFRVAAVNGAGTGCVYPAGAGLTASVTTACGTSQPSAAVSIEGSWQ